jgi:subtilisin family serine protease
VSAPGENITSLSANGGPTTFGGTSAAAPFVTGAIALLWSEFPDASAAELRVAITRSRPTLRNSVIPAVLDAEAAYQVMAAAHNRRNVS